MKQPNKDGPSTAKATKSPDEGTTIDPSTGEVRDRDGLLVDEYSDDSLADQPSQDALDLPKALVSEAMIEELSDASDGISPREVRRRVDVMDTVDSGARQTPSDDGEMELGPESHSAEDLERASIGRALKGAAGVTRDGEPHGERLFDSPDSAS